MRDAATSNRAEQLAVLTHDGNPLDLAACYWSQHHT